MQERNLDDINKFCVCLKYHLSCSVCLYCYNWYLPCKDIGAWGHVHTRVCVCTLRNENVLQCSFRFGGSRQIIILIEETTTTYKINYAYVGSFSLTKQNLSQNESGTWFNEMQNQNSAIPQLGKNTKQFTQTNTICIISNQSNKILHFFLLYYFLNAVITNISKWELQWAVGVLSAVVGLGQGVLCTPSWGDATKTMSWSILAKTL